MRGSTSFLIEWTIPFLGFLQESQKELNKHENEKE